MTAAAAQALVSPRSKRNQARARTGTARGSAPVRRGSVSSEDPDDFTRFMSMADAGHLMKVLKTYAAEHRGKHGVAPLTASALHIAEKMLFQLMDRRTGRIEHAYGWIAEHTRRAYQTACAAIGQLEGLGVLKVQRRCRRGDGPDAPPWVQDVNLYRFELPEKLRAWWNERKAKREARERRRAPDDATHAERAAKATTAAQEAEWHAWKSTEAKAAREAEDRRLAGVVQGPGAAAFRKSFGPS